MCYHSQQTKTALEIIKRFKAEMANPDLFVPKVYNGFDYPKTPIILNTQTDKIKFYHWGLIPRWSKSQDIRKNTLNAKIETLEEKPSFRDVIQNRCLILVDGFFEWQWLDPKGKQKQKYKITHQNNDAFALAGIYNTWIDPATDLQRSTYSIITTAANPFMAIIHNSKKRMPVMLTPEREKDWLSGVDYRDFAEDEINLVAEKV